MAEQRARKADVDGAGVGSAALVKTKKTDSASVRPRSSWSQERPYFISGHISTQCFYLPASDACADCPGGGALNGGGFVARTPIRQADQRATSTLVPADLPIAIAIPAAPSSAVTPLSAKGPTARILAAFARGDDGDDDDTDFSDDDDDPSFTFSCDAIRGVWTRASPAVYIEDLSFCPLVLLASRLTSSLLYLFLSESASRHRVWGHASTSTSG
ncbi:hypothetical protein K438DRAFT_1979688 [Mycena galopus ATCC 62051]|nr:hypothetical protein K438DRAFT_1979688 [Mycena galopus ATCC 62051]